MKNTTKGCIVALAALSSAGWETPGLAQESESRPISALVGGQLSDLADQPSPVPLASARPLQADTSASPAREVRQNEVWMAKGNVAWEVAGNVGLSHGGSSTRKFGSLVLGLDRVFTDPVGPGFLRGRLAVHIELLPVFALSQESATYAVGFNLLGRNYLDVRGPLRPFITVGAGMLVSDDAIPTGTANLNFTPQVGFGVAFLMLEAASSPSSIASTISRTVAVSTPTRGSTRALFSSASPSCAVGLAKSLADPSFASRFCGSIVPAGSPEIEAGKLRPVAGSLIRGSRQGYRK